MDWDRRAIIVFISTYVGAFVKFSRFFRDHDVVKINSKPDPGHANCLERTGGRTSRGEWEEKVRIQSAGAPVCQSTEKNLACNHSHPMQALV